MSAGLRGCSKAMSVGRKFGKDDLCDPVEVWGGDATACGLLLSWG